MLAVIDYGAGNLRSVLHALTHLGANDLQLARKPGELQGARKIILPGVGAFGASMAQLRQQGLVAPLKEALAAGIPYLGICIGMQILYEVGEEMGEHEGLGLLSGRVIRFPRFETRKVPHMGWNRVRQHRLSPQFECIPDEAHFYFVHESS